MESPAVHMPSTHRLDTALRHGVSHRIHYSPRNAPKSGSILKPYTRRTSAHRPPSSMRLRPRLWPFVFAPQSAQVPPCPVSVQCAVACARAARCSPPSPQLAHAMCRGWPKSRPHLPRRRRTLMPHVPLHSTAPPSASPPSHAVCRCARLRLPRRRRPLTPCAVALDCAFCC